ncbi:MAG: phosphoribosyltransferase family protein [Gammaproteobacteria bacterium]|nr:phosphoribosyltransferase family protein [Gammaproteobacteria bacterium]
MSVLFHDRAEAGKKLAKRLTEYKQHADAIVLGLPRGGIIPASEVAKSLNIPMDILLVRRLYVEEQNHLAIGAITSGGHKILNQEVIQRYHISSEQVDAAEQTSRALLQSRERRYRGVVPEPTLAGHTVILVDDGMKSGATMQVAIASLRSQNPARIIVAVPLATQHSLDTLNHADEVICLQPMGMLASIADGYKEFHRLDDDEVSDLLAEVKRFQYQDFDIPPFV